MSKAAMDAAYEDERTNEALRKIDDKEKLTPKQAAKYRTAKFLEYYNDPEKLNNRVNSYSEGVIFF